MYKNIYWLISILFYLFLVNTSTAQIWYKLDLLEDGETYQISLVSDEEWLLPNNITSTGQISIKAPTLELEIEAFESIHPGLIWEYNSRFNAPEEENGADYFSFGLENSSRDFEYEAGEEIPIIRFKNAKGCSDYISLIDNELDPYIFSNLKQVNIGNQLTVVGANGNAYIGNLGEKEVRCQKLIRRTDLFLKDYKIYPNPASNRITIDMDWKKDNQDNYLYVRNNSGKVVLERLLQLRTGFNKIELDISSLIGGIYHIELTSSKQESISLDPFVKIYSASIDNRNIEDEEDKSPRKKSLDRE